jgi:hypothetical protein
VLGEFRMFVIVIESIHVFAGLFDRWIVALLGCLG